MDKTTDFGKEIKIKLITMGKPQNWLIEQVKEKTGLFFDSSYLHKILVGKLKTPAIVNAICEILGLPEQEAK